MARGQKPLAWHKKLKFQSSSAEVSYMANLSLSYSYDTAGKRVTGRALVHEYLSRVGSFKPDRQIIFLPGFQPRERSFARILIDSGAIASQIIGIDSDPDHFGIAEYNKSQFPGMTCIEGFWDVAVEDLRADGNWNPGLVVFDGTNLPYTDTFIETAHRTMNLCGSQVMIGFTVSLKSQYETYDGIAGQPNIKGAGRYEFINQLKARMGSDADRWFTTEPLAGFYKAGRKTSRTPMGIYVFFSDGMPSPKNMQKTRTLGLLKTREDYEALNRSASKVTNFFQPISKISHCGPRPPFEQWENQKKAEAAILKFFASPEVKGMIIEPPGSGKTHTESRAIVNHNELYGGELYALFTHRIMLAKQVCEEFHRVRPSGFNVQLAAINSGGQFILPHYSGDTEHHLVKPVTSVEEIRRAIANASSGNPLVLFCLYQSADVLREALLAEGRQLDLSIEDEAHKVTSKLHNAIINPALPKENPGSRIIPTKQTLFFTATKKTSGVVIDRSMDNVQLYGEEIHRTTPLESQYDGRTLPVKLRTVTMDTQDILDAAHATRLNEREQAEEREFLESIAGLRAVLDAKINRISPGAEIRLLTFCSNAHTQPKKFLENEWLECRFPDFFFSFITANECYYREPGKPYIRKATREYVLECVADYPYSVLFHYDTISEGINIPNLTDVTFLRGVGKDTMIHGIGRVQRLDPWDRLRYEDGTITIVADEATGELEYPGWKKECGDVWFIVKDSTDQKEVNRFTDYIFNMTEAGEQFWVNDITHIYNGKATRKVFNSGEPKYRTDPNATFFADIAEKAAKRALKRIAEISRRARILLNRRGRTPKTLEQLEKLREKLCVQLEAAKKISQTKKAHRDKRVGGAAQKKAWITIRKNAEKLAKEKDSQNAS